MTLIACTWGMQAQTRTYHGTVLDASNNEPLVGATVMPIGGGQGVAADVDGEFTLTVPASVKKATVSYVGYKSQEVTLSDGMIVKLESSSSNLDEMIVVAYGTAKKSAFTGSATVVGAEEIEKSQVTNALNALTGKVAGVQLSNPTGQPGQNDPTIFIRGISSLNAGNSPLYIVNGAPYPGDINNINPADIESMTVLKDAASNALYGARGANGVILITTKKGKTGQNATVTVDAKWGSNSKAMQEYKTIRDPRQYYELYYRYLKNFAMANGLSDSSAHVFANNNLTNNSSYGLGYLTYTIPDGEYIIGSNGKFNGNATKGAYRTYNGMEYYLQPDDWYDAAYKNSLRQEYNLSISKGTDGTNFYISANYLNNEGITPNSNYERFTTRLTADTQVNNWLKVGGDVSYTYYRSKFMTGEGSTNSSGNIFAFTQQIAPIYPLYIRDASGKIMRNDAGLKMYDYGDGENAGLVRPFFNNANAISDAMYDTSKYNGNAFTGLGFAEVRFLKDFRITSNNSFNYDETLSTYVNNPYFGNGVETNGTIQKISSRSINYTFQQLLNWEHTFGVNNVAALVGHENYVSISNALSAYKLNLFDPSVEELNGALQDGSMSSSAGKYNNEGWLFRVQYNYDEKYFGSGSFRRDASSRFDPKHRWGNFWSLGGAWLINKENFMMNASKWLDLLKIKVSYGEQGNDNIGDFLYTSTYSIVNSNGSASVIPGTLGNPNISWEKNGNLNYGVEFEMFNGRFSGSIEGFWRKTSDMLSWFTLPPSYGWTGYWDNIGDMTNTGVEIDLQGTLIATKDVTWTANFNLTYYKNKLSYLPEERKTMEVDGVRGYSSGEFFYGEGIPLQTYHLFKYAYPDSKTGEALYWHKIFENGKDTGKREAVPYSKLDSDNDYFLCGSTLPPVYGGFGTSVSFFGFDFSIDFSYSCGGKILDNMYMIYMGSPTQNMKGYNFHEDLLNAWTPTNTGSNIPALYFNDTSAATTSDRFLVDASYLNLQTINFGYSFPQKWVNKMKLQQLRIYFAADNVYYWAKRKGLDPRQSITGDVSNVVYSPIRTLSGGLSVTF
ncbi:MAG: TonB-dependent receptor [Muribaculaceae bacterium]|nr:TonB-dependent receptor [Muribaculaceae bacterium]